VLDRERGPFVAKRLQLAYAIDAAFPLLVLAAPAVLLREWLGIEFLAGA